MSKFTILIALCLVISIGFIACEQQYTTSTDADQARKTELLVAEANRQVGMPNIVNFTERKFAKMILELRDTEVATYTYIVDMHGKFHFLCESIGYGIPYSVQYTNPQKIVDRGRSTTTYRSVTVPQPDPNGLFMPSSSSATWVLAVKEGSAGLWTPMYVEPQIVVSTFELDSVN